MVLSPDGSGGLKAVGFDAIDPPDTEDIASCVHCGMCLSACPTYVLWGNEADSPRGRIYQMKLIKEGNVALDAATTGHFDRCLGCMACMTACPSGVPYDRLIEATRAQVERKVARPVRERGVRALAFFSPHPARLRAAAIGLFFYQRLRLGRVLRVGIAKLPRVLRNLEALSPPVTWAGLRSRTPTFTPAHGLKRRKVALVTGCVQSVFFPKVNTATARVLATEGCDVFAPPNQPCCGALSDHTGRRDEARDYARRMLDTFGSLDVDDIVVNAAGCGSMLKGYAALLEHDAAYADRARVLASKVRDVSELVAELSPRAPRNAVVWRVAMHDACHLQHAQGVKEQPRAMLRGIPGLELVEIDEGDMCCGSAGIYNLLQPESAEELGRRKAKNIDALQADVIVAANPGCVLQIRRYLEHDVPVVHPIELLDASLRGVGLGA